jgi:hypothetical protein
LNYHFRRDAKTPIFERVAIKDILREVCDIDVRDKKNIRCPLPGHRDASPSFRATAGVFICFGCGRKGGLIDLLIALGCADSRRDALNWLKERF